jgi:branched-chain amino acid transport system permease protein
MKNGSTLAAPSLPVTVTRKPDLRTYGGWLAVAVVMALLPHVPGLNADFGHSLLSQMGIAAVFALSYNMLLGQTGLLSFGHAVYFGLGGYAAIHLMRAINHGLPIPMPLVPLAGAAAGLLSGILFGAVSTRRAGTIFALISLGIGELVYASTFMLPALFGGEEGITANRTRAPALFGLTLGSQLEVYYVIAVWALIAAMLMRAFTRTPLGRMCNAVRDNPERAEFIGYNAQHVRFFAFAFAGMFAGLAGGLHAINYEIVAADAIGAQRSGTVLLMAYIGGVTHFAGPVVGAITLTWLQTSLSAYTGAWLLYIGLFFMAIILFAPSGTRRPHSDAPCNRPHASVPCSARFVFRRARSCARHGRRRRAADRNVLPGFDGSGAWDATAFPRRRAGSLDPMAVDWRRRSAHRRLRCVSREARAGGGRVGSGDRRSRGGKDAPVKRRPMGVAPRSAIARRVVQ